MFDIMLAVYIVSTVCSLLIYLRILYVDTFTIVQMKPLGFLLPFLPIANTFLVLDTVRLYLQDVIKKIKWKRRPRTTNVLDRDINSLYPNSPIKQRVELIDEHA